MTINRRLAELKLASALNRESEDPTIKRILEDVEAVRQKGRQAVTVNAHLAKLRAAGRRLREAAEPLVQELESVRADASRPVPRFSDGGRAEEERRLLAELETAVVKEMTEYNEIERALIESYPDPGPPQFPMTEDDLSRAMLLLRRADDLSPVELLGEFEKAVRRFDRATTEALLPRARRALESEDLAVAPRATLERLTTFVHLGQQLMLTGPDGWKTAAREEAITEAHRIRADAETVADTILSEGSLAGVEMMARLVASDARDEDGRPIERPGGAFPSLDPLFGDASREP